jgi:hypothetical protein
MIISLMFVGAFALAALPSISAAQDAPFEEPTGSPTAVSTAEEIASFASEIIVRPDGVVGVTERIDYHFPEPRHGIYRDIPIVYVIDGDKTVRIPVENIQVSGAPFTMERQRDSIRIRIGDPDTYVEGLRSYVIDYELHGALSYGDASDKLIFDVTGNDWTVPIRRVSAVVRLPDGIDSASVTARCFTGDHGSTAQDCLVNRMGNDIHYAAEDPLTVEAEWGPTGLVARLEPEQPSAALIFIRDRLIPLIGISIPIGALLFMIRKWRKKGRDRGLLGAVPPQYDAPEGMRPALMGVIADEKVDHRDLAATLIHLAVRGHVKIDEVQRGKLFASTDFDLTWLENADDTLDEFERLLLKAIFGSATAPSSVSLSKIKSSETVYADMQKAKERLYADAEEKGHFVVDPSEVRDLHGKIGIVVGALGLFGLFFAGFAGLFPSVFLLAGGVLVSGIIVAAFASAMPAKTEKGVDAYRHILGFREYLDKAEKYRLQWQEKENVLDTFLPYAMVFGVAEKWTKQIARFGVEMKQPSWYSGAMMSGGAFDAGTFARSMSSFGSSMGKVDVKPSNSNSFSSGGGFSGGGVGGGGGGSW